jgi:hypothetical protein
MRLSAISETAPPFQFATDGGEIYRKLIIGKSVGF